MTETFEKLMDAHRSQLWRFALSLTKGRREDAEDLLAEAQFRAWRGFADYDQTRSFPNWLCRIIERLWMDSARNAGRRVKALSYDVPIADDGDPLLFDPPTLAPSPLDEALRPFEHSRVDRVLRRLPEQQRIAVRLRIVDDLTFAEVAKALRCPVGTCRSRVHRGFNTIRRQLGVAA